MSSDAQGGGGLTTGWKVVIVIAFLGALFGGGKAERDARRAEQRARRAENEARRLEGRVRRIEAEMAKLRKASDAPRPARETGPEPAAAAEPATGTAEPEELPPGEEAPR